MMELEKIDKKWTGYEYYEIYTDKNHRNPRHLVGFIEIEKGKSIFHRGDYVDLDINDMLEIVEIMKRIELNQERG